MQIFIILFYNNMNLRYSHTFPINLKLYERSHTHSLCGWQYKMLTAD